MRRRWTSMAVGAGVLGVAAGLAAVRGQGPGEGRGRFGGGPPAFPLMQALDADGDGELSAKEIENASAALKTLDRDKNGKLTREEMFPAFGMGRGGMGMGPGANVEETVRSLMALDKDGDGKLSRAELPERLRALMDRADANKDGFLDRNELTEFARSRAGRGPGFGPGGRDGEGPRRKGEGPGRDGGDGERRGEGRRETDV